MKKFISVAALIALILISFPVFSAEAKKATVYHPVFGDMKVVTVGSPTAFTGGYKLWINTEEFLGGKSFRPSAYSTTLASSLAERGSEPTLKVNSITLKDGTSLAEANYGSLLILTVGTGDNEEKIAVSNLATSTKAFTIISRGLEYGRWASSTTNIKQHLPGERVFVSDDDHFLNQIYSDLVTAETISGQKTFTLSPIIPTPISSNLTYAANVDYVNNVATSGAANLSETVKGIGEGATQSEMQAGTATGGTGAALLLQNKFATSTPMATTSIPITKTNGKLNQGFIDLTEAFTFAATTTFNSNISFPNDSYGAGFTHMTVKTTSGTWAVPAGVRKIKVKVQGSGGSSADSSAGGNCSGGGGGGGYAEKIIDVTATTSITYSIGAVGQVTSFSTYASSTSGANSVDTGNTGLGASGGVGNGGDININGQNGGSCLGGTFGGLGGFSHLGFGGTGAINSAGTDRGCSNGFSYGGGAGGDEGSAGASACTGASGVIIIEY